MSRHRWKGATKRNRYALVLSRPYGVFVRVWHFGGDQWSWGWL